MITKQQYRKLMSEYQATGNVTNSALKAAMSRPTARKYVTAAQPPQELQAKHGWRTRKDPLVEIWPQAETLLAEAPDLEAKALFEHLWERSPWAVQEKHLRTFQRRVKRWRLAHGADQEVFFPQDWEAGRALQLDWTNADELGITIAGEPYAHLLCHCVLPHSNWEWATRCLSESFLSLVTGLQAALVRLGKSPPNLGTDNTSAATHELEDMPGRPRAYNTDYLELCTHYDLSPLTIHVGKPNEQGDVESLNRHLKRRLNQHLILRGSRDFASLEEYDRFVEGVLRKANAKRQKRLEQELACMRALPESRLADYREYAPLVSSQSLIHVRRHAYSVPSRLIGHTLRVELYEPELKVYLGRDFLFCLPRLRGKGGALVNFRHVIESLLRKPGAFINYRHREALYPSPTFRAAYDRLVEDHGERPGLIEYLHVLRLAAAETVEAVETLLKVQLAGSSKWRATDVRDQVAPPVRPFIELAELTPSLSAYDALLKGEVAHVA